MESHNLQQWCNLEQLTGREKFLFQIPKNKKQSLLLLNSHRHIIQRHIASKGIKQSLSYLPGSFSNLALEIEYLSFIRQRSLSLNELPRWKHMFTQFVREKQQGQKEASNLSAYATIDNSNFDNQQTHIVFLNHIADSLLQRIANIKLSSFEAFNFQTNQLKIRYSISQILQFVDSVLPQTLTNFILKRQQLPQCLQSNYNLDCLYCCKQMQYIVKRCPNYCILIMLLLQIILSNIKRLKPNDEKVLMDIVFRYFYLCHQKKKYKSMEIFVLAINKISRDTRQGLRPKFALFMSTAEKIGKQRFIRTLLKKSKWLLEIYQENCQEEKMIGHILDKFNPFSTQNFGEVINIGPGKSVLRYFQCVEQYSLLFFRLQIKNLDIKIRIQLVEDFISQIDLKQGFQSMEIKSVQTQLFHTFILPHKGIYSIEFDNTYSWINDKTIRYQKRIFNPLTLQSNTKYSFLSNYYLLEEINSISSKYIINYSDHKLRVFINKGKIFFRYSFQKGKRHYEYQTDCKERLLQKIHQISQAQDCIQFYIRNRFITEISEIQKFVKKHCIPEIDKKQINIDLNSV